jgi:perosamine synthetase
MNRQHAEVIEFIRRRYGSGPRVALHEPVFAGNEKEYVCDAIDSTFVSSVGRYVDRFEDMIAGLADGLHAVATVNGPAALHLALRLAGVGPGDEVITQPLTFVATANAINYCGARPVFLDVDRETLGLSPDSVLKFLERSADRDSAGTTYNRRTGRRIAACVPMHTFGHPCRIDELTRHCEAYGIPVVEDAAEALGSRYRSRQTGTFGLAGIYSFNGNKIVTCGGGGAIVTADASLAKRAKHLSTTAKRSHPWEYLHDEVAYNYRMPNINAALACAQLEQLPKILAHKRQLAESYQTFFERVDIQFVREPPMGQSNYWLNAIIMPDREARNEFLSASNQAGVMTRPIWRLLNALPMYTDCEVDDLEHARWLEDRVVNIPSSVPPQSA